MTGSNMSNALANAACQRCQARFAPAERIVNSNGELYHEQCFVCAQCFRPFPEGLFYEFEGRKYCEHDFQMLFAPCCGSCGKGWIQHTWGWAGGWEHRCSSLTALHPASMGTSSLQASPSRALGGKPWYQAEPQASASEGRAWEGAAGVGVGGLVPAPANKDLSLPGEFIIGRVIKAMNNNWHPGCFRCELCDIELADLGFVKNAGRHLCRPCHNREKAKGLGKYVCQRCHLVIDEKPLMFKNDAYHPDHFSCTHCGKELTAEARELKGELYCLPCHDKMGVPICGACRRPIEGRVVNALGKQWHVEHFVCAKCEKPFLGHRHYEKKGLAYCETHYNQLFGDVCYNCSHVIEGDVVSALNKAWCVNCFSCSTCNSKLTLKNKFVEFDMKPVCKRCYEKFPLELKKRLKKLSELAARKAHPKSVGLNSA
ncbi:LIM and senescent cell antigen-like-containing domain protein 2 isoform X1 [Herpailurus yagouaroundi]|uniref:LIM and senescent cell antigen-like-containing domain protein 2 isoform X1 n=1 Tax=Herpailurus yagouaroundi TaxID=1608482 RepID=UPI001AD7A397|nr:LIM and senescent cell antigen-like-containing domain protein 2 isoform X1 [Puma yagouaroundi]